MKMKNKMKAKTKMKIKMNFRYCFDFVFHFRFGFCFCFLKSFCIFVNSTWPRGGINDQLSLTWPRRTNSIFICEFSTWPSDATDG